VGEAPDLPDVQIRIEASASNGRPISWSMNIPSWGNLPIAATSSTASQWNVASRVRSRLLFPFIWIVMGLFFARRNLRTGRGDRRGATRLAWFIFALGSISYLFAEHHIATVRELDLLLHYAAIFLFWAVMFWMFYIALEPFVRRHLPGLLVGWSRLLAGEFRDPIVGRDLLMGSVAGLVGVLLNYLRFPLASLLDATQIRPSAVLMAMAESTGLGRSGTLYLLSGNHAVVSSVLYLLVGCIAMSVVISFIFFLFRFLLRRTWAAVTTLLIFVTAANSMGEPSLFSFIALLL
jgi:hypothetical protein